MRKIALTIMILLVPSVCSYADRVCLEKSTGKLIEYQSGDAPLGTLTKNAVNAGYAESDVEEKYVTSGEWAVIRESQIETPRKIKENEDKKDIEKAVSEIKQKLGFTDKEWNALKKALR